MDSMDGLARGRKIVPLRTYVWVYLSLVILTALEIFLYSPASGLARQVQTPLFLLLSLSKAALVAAFYMHLRYDNRLYTYIFVLPAFLLGVFAFLAVIT
jgi:cytochrome c oxidase subunit 4